MVGLETFLQGLRWGLFEIMSFSKRYGLGGFKRVMMCVHMYNEARQCNGVPLGLRSQKESCIARQSKVNLYNSSYTWGRS